MILYQKIDFVCTKDQVLFEEALKMLEALLAANISTVSVIAKHFYLSVYNFAPYTNDIMGIELFVQTVGTAITNRKCSVETFVELVESYRFEKGAPLLTVPGEASC